MNFMLFTDLPSTIQSAYLSACGISLSPDIIIVTDLQNGFISLSNNFNGVVIDYNFSLYLSDERMRGVIQSNFEKQYPHYSVVNVRRCEKIYKVTFFDENGLTRYKCFPSLV